MRIAIFATDQKERYLLSRLAEDTLLKHGILSEATMFPMLSTFCEALEYSTHSFTCALVTGVRDVMMLKELCRHTKVIVIGGKEDGIDAFDVGAGYFLERPINEVNLDKALARCLLKKGVDFMTEKPNNTPYV